MNDLSSSRPFRAYLPAVSMVLLMACTVPDGVVTLSASSSGSDSTGWNQEEGVFATDLQGQGADLLFSDSGAGVRCPRLFLQGSDLCRESDGECIPSVMVVADRSDCGGRLPRNRGPFQFRSGEDWFRGTFERTSVRREDLALYGEIRVLLEAL